MGRIYTQVRLGSLEVRALCPTTARTQPVALTDLVRPLRVVGVILALLLGLACDGTGGTPCELLDCPEGKQCVSGVCVVDQGSAADCVDDSSCAEGWFCDSGTCAPIPPDPLCESVTCPSGEHCVNGGCILDDALVPCLIDTDCDLGQACLNGTCAATSNAKNELALDNPDIDFGALLVAESYALVAPDPTDGIEETTNDQDSVSDADDTVIDDGSGNGETDPQGRQAPPECVCQWTVEDAAAATFDLSGECATTMTPAQAGSFDITVAVTCGEVFELFTQTGVATVPPTSCTVNDDCGDVEECVEGSCAPRSGPVIAVLGERARSPFVVAFDLRIEDVNGNPIHEGVTRDQFRIFEDDREIDYAETEYTVTSAPNLRLKIMLVLDYTVSMENAGAIGSMVSAAKEFIGASHFTATHHIGVVEFHDRRVEGEGFSTVAPLTPADSTGKTEVIGAIPLEDTLEPGLSRTWDAVGLAITHLQEVERQPGERRAIVFLTDGRDTTSETDADSILASANADDIALYPIGFGDVTASETQLRDLADQTHGTYFPAASAATLSDVFADIALDLRGQWTLGYVTQRNSGTVAVRVEFAWKDAVGSFQSEVNVSSLDGDIHAAVIEVLDRSYNETADTTGFLLRVGYAPRLIQRFRFYIPIDGAVLAIQGLGGLTQTAEGWTLLTSNGWFDLIGPAPIQQGSFGNIGQVILPGDQAVLPIAHDDTIYEDQAQPKTVAFEGATYKAPYTLTVDVEPEGGGAVGITPSQFAYASGEVVSLVASAIGDHVFDRWEGGVTGTDSNTSVTMDANKTVTAKYHPPRILTVVITPPARGTVTVSPDRTAYRQGEVVVLTATPSSSAYVFSAWSGDVTGTTASATITLDSDETVTATFADAP